MRRLRFVAVGLLFIAALTMLPACGGGGGGGGSNSYVGTWALFEYNGRPASGYTITINSDGTARLFLSRYNAVVYVTYTVSGNTYYVYYNGRLEETGTWAVDGDILGMCNSTACYRYRRV